MLRRTMAHIGELEMEKEFCLIQYSYASLETKKLLSPWATMETQ